MKVNYEEHAALGDFLKASFVRDQSEIMKRYPKLDAAFLDSYEQQLNTVKLLESSFILTEAQKNATIRLNSEAYLLNGELGFLVDYFKDAKLETGIVTALRNNLGKDNIEGAVLKIEGLAQYITLHKNVLTEEGMAADFADTLRNHKESMSTHNEIQNSAMNSRKNLNAENKAQYKQLLTLIRKIANAGKKVYAGTVKKDEYNITKNVSRMRAAKRHENDAA